jgi:hypothetical protein
MDMPIQGLPTFTAPGAELAKMPEEIQDVLLKKAQAKRENAKANMPFGGEILPGAAGQVQGLELMKGLYGENSPQYNQALNAFNLNQQGMQSRIGYQNALTNTADKRFSTPLAKNLQEQNDIANGYLPGSKIPLTMEQKQAYQNMYGLENLKKTTDQDTRKKNLYAHNMDITLNSIDPTALTRYSGLAGGMKLIQDKKNSLLGKTSPEYKAYEANLTRAKTLAKQVRQFYGDSITSGVQEGLSKLTNPSSWLKNPEVAMNNFNQFAQLLRQEAKTYQQAGQSPAIYSGTAGQSPMPQEEAQQGGDDLDRMAQEAIQKGADPKAVMAELSRLRGGQ